MVKMSKLKNLRLLKRSAIFSDETSVEKEEQSSLC